MRSWPSSVASSPAAIRPATLIDSCVLLDVITGDQRWADWSATEIAAAMQQQGATTHDIARHIAEAADGTRHVTNNIGGVAEAAETTSQAAVSLRGASEDLRREATSLNDEMIRFFDDMRAA